MDSTILGFEAMHVGAALVIGFFGLLMAPLALLLIGYLSVIPLGLFAIGLSIFLFPFRVAHYAYASHRDPGLQIDYSDCIDAKLLRLAQALPGILSGSNLERTHNQILLGSAMVATVVTLVRVAEKSTKAEKH